MPFNIYNLNTLLKYILSKTFKFQTFLRLCKQFLNYSIESGVLKFVTLALFWRLRRVTSKDYRCFKCWCWRKFWQWVARWHNKRRNLGCIKTAVFPRRGYAVSTLCCETWSGRFVQIIFTLPNESNDHDDGGLYWICFSNYMAVAEKYTLTATERAVAMIMCTPYLRSLWDIWNAQNRLMEMTVGSMPLQIW